MAGKGDKCRIEDKDKFDSEFDRIFGKRDSFGIKIDSEKSETKNYEDKNQSKDN